MRHSPLRILHVIPGLNHGGAEWDLIRLVSGLNGHQISSAVVCLKEPGPLVKVLEDQGVLTQCLQMRGRLGGVRQLGGLRKFVQAYQPDLIQGWLYHGDLASAWAARPLQIPVVWNVRQAHFVSGQSPLTRALAHLCAHGSVQFPKAIVCCSAASKNAHIKMGYDSSKIVVIENGIDLQRFVPSETDRRAVRAQWGASEGTVYVGIVGRLDPAKDIHTFLRAFALFVQTHPNVKGVWIGGENDDERHHRQTLVEQYGLRDLVELRSATLGLEKEMRGLDLLVSSSKSEGFGNVVGEALASGVPCISTDVGAAKEMIRDSQYVVPPEDSSALVQAMSDWHDAGPAAWKEMGESGRAHIQEHFSFNRVVHRFARLYRELL